MKKPEFFLDENLRFRASDPAHLNQYIHFLHEQLKALSEPKDLVRVMGELGVHLRSADRFEEATKMLTKALEVIAEKNLGIGSEVQQKIRLAHVYQEEKKFGKSDALFGECLELCRKHQLDYYFPFVLQHSGKNLFDQKHYGEALKYFEQARALRLQNKAPQDQIASTEEAIRETKKRLMGQS